MAVRLTERGLSSVIGLVIRHRRFALNLGLTKLEDVTMPRNFVVYLDSGVSVEVPDSVNSGTDEGVRQIKEAAKQKFLAMLADHLWDVQIEEEADTD